MYLKRCGFSLGLCLLASGLIGQPFQERINLGSIAGNGGVLLTGTGANSDHGKTVVHAGDLNRDGFDDLAVSAPEYPGNFFSSDEGAVYVVFGGPSAQLDSIDLEALDGSNGFRVYGLENSDKLGSGLDRAGDVNGDGFDDLIIGASGKNGTFNSGGGGYVIFGRNSFPAVVDLTLLDGTNGFRFDAVEKQDEAGVAVAGLGDFNGDGLDDFAIGAWRGADRSGQVYVGYGRRIFPAVVQLSSLDGTSGFTMNGAPDTWTGDALAAVGDVNADGLQDLLIGARWDDALAANSGAAYLVFGRTNSPASLDLKDLDGTTGAAFVGDSAIDEVGTEVAAAGDIDQDGFDDILIGTPGEDRGGLQSGIAYLVYGRASYAAESVLEEMAAGEVVALFGTKQANVAGDGVGDSADVNGDGIPDLLVGAHEADPHGNQSGEAYVIFGGSVLPDSFALDQLDGDNGATFEGPTKEDNAGDSLSGIGDFNGDGVGDIAIGSPGYDNPIQGDTEGFAHIVFGRSPTGVTFGATGGLCPGPIEFRSRGLTADGAIEIYRGSGRGTSTLAEGPCAGSALEIEDAVLITQQTADDSGVWLFSADVGAASSCGTFVQLIDLTTCTTSNVTTLPQND